MYRKLLRKVLLLSFFCLTSFLSTEASMANSFEAGYSAFEAGNYREAKSLLKRSIQRTRDPYDKALIYKLLGIIEYKEGRRASGKSYFRMALKIDPQIEMTASEAGSRSILRAFQSLQKRSDKRDSRVRRGRKSRRADKRRSRSSSKQYPQFHYMYAVPFGGGQFYQGKTLFGAGFATAQALSLALAFFNRQRYQENEKTTIEAEAEFEGDENKADKEQEFLDFLNQSEAYTLEAQQYEQLSYAAFAIFYAASVAEAVFNRPSAPATRRRSKRRRAAVDTLKPNQELESIYIAQSTVNAGLRLRPSYHPKQKSPYPMMNLSYSF